MEGVVTVVSRELDELRAAYAGARVFLTGHTGFKGAWLALWLTSLGAEVHGYALEPPTDPSLFLEADVEAAIASSTIADVRDRDAVEVALVAADPTHVFHLAAQPLVRLSYDTPVETFDVNVMGTVHVLEAARRAPSLRSIVVVTSDKCYENVEWEYAYREPDAMGGKDPYSASKGAAEIVAASYARSFFATGDVGVATVRAGNVIGGGDWALDRIVPDCVRALAADAPITIRNPSAVRPWQHVLEPLAGYLQVGARLAASPSDPVSAWNFGPLPEGHVDVGTIADLAVAAWGSGSWVHDAPDAPVAEANLLRLDAGKAMTRLGWHPLWTVEQAVTETIAWYRGHANGDDARSITLDQIDAYQRRTTWATAPEMAGNR
jgi:CDP-glucose 4,6-dehydratase